MLHKVLFYLQVELILPLFFLTNELTEFSHI